MCDIEEALEDAIGGGERAREWWKGKGVDFNTNDKEWTKLSGRKVGLGIIARLPSSFYRP
jgi:hypothetical protein